MLGSVVAKGLGVGICGPLVSMGMYGAWKAWEAKRRGGRHRGEDDDVVGVTIRVGKTWVVCLPLTIPVSIILILCGQPDALLFNHSLSAALSGLFLGWGLSLVLQALVLERGKDTHLGGGMRVLLGMTIAVWLGYGTLMSLVADTIDSLYAVQDMGVSVLITACVGGGVCLLGGALCVGLGRSQIGRLLMLGGAEVASVAAALLAFHKILLGSPRLQDTDYLQHAYHDIRLPRPTRTWMALAIGVALVRAAVAWWVGVGGKPGPRTLWRLLDLFVETGTLMMPMGMATTAWVMIRCDNCIPPRPAFSVAGLTAVFLAGEPTSKPYVFLLGAAGLLMAVSVAFRTYAERSIVIHGVVTGFLLTLLAALTLPLENMIGEILGESHAQYSNMAPLNAVKGTTLHAFRNWIWVVPFVWGAGYAWGVCVDHDDHVDAERSEQSTEVQ